MMIERLFIYETTKHYTNKWYTIQGLRSFLSMYCVNRYIIQNNMYNLECIDVIYQD